MTPNTYWTDQPMTSMVPVEGSDVERLDNYLPRSLDFRPLWDQACAQIDMLEELGTLENCPEAVVRRTLVGVLIHALRYIDVVELDASRSAERSDKTERELAELVQRTRREGRLLKASVRELDDAYKGTSERVLDAIIAAAIKADGIVCPPLGMGYDRWNRLSEMKL